MEQGHLNDFLTYYKSKIKSKFYQKVLNKKRTLFFGAGFFLYLLPLTLIITHLTSHINLLLFQDLLHLDSLLMTNAYITLLATLFFDYKKENKFFNQLSDNAHEFNTMQSNKNSSYHMLEAFYQVKLISMIYQLNSLKGVTYNSHTAPILLKQWDELKKRKQENANLTQKEIKDICIFLDRQEEFIHKYHQLSLKEVENIFFDMIECSLKTQAIYHMKNIDSQYEAKKKSYLKSLKL